MKKTILLAILLTLILFTSFASATVQRSFTPLSVNPDANVYVTLTFTLDENNSIYGIDENFPSEFILADAGNGTSNASNNIKWFDFEATPGLITLTYTLTAPSTQGTYSFNGEYIFEEDENISTIGGSASLIVSAGIPPTPPPSGGTGGSGSGGNGGAGSIPPTDDENLDVNNPSVDILVDQISCGDSTCNGNETCLTCQEDCGQCYTPPNEDYNLNSSTIVIDLNSISEAGREPINYAYIILGLSLIAAIYAIFRLLRIRKGEPPSTIDWDKLKIGIRNA